VAVCKVALRFAVICITTIALGVFASQRMGAMSDEIVNLAGNWLPTVKVLRRCRLQTERYRANLVLFAIADNELRRAQAKGLMNDARAKAEALMVEYQPLITPGKEQGPADDFKRNGRRWSRPATPLWRRSETAIERPPWTRCLVSL
jgi:methyl-accepting chemotaxis protein